MDHVPWVKRELSLGSEEAGESKVLVSGGVVGQADGALQSDRAGTGPNPGAGPEVRGPAAQQPWLEGGADPDSDVGGGFYLQMVNTVMAVYDADTGAKVVGPLLMSELFDPATQKLYHP